MLLEQSNQTSMQSSYAIRVEISTEKPDSRKDRCNYAGSVPTD